MPILSWCCMHSPCKRQEQYVTVLAVDRGKGTETRPSCLFFFSLFFVLPQGTTRPCPLQQFICIADEGPTDLFVATTYAVMLLLFLLVGVVVVVVLADHPLPSTVSIPFESCDSSSRRQSLASLSLFSINKSSHRILAPPSPFLLLLPLSLSLSFTLWKTLLALPATAAN